MAARYYSPEFCIEPDDEEAFTEEELESIVELVRESSFFGDESGLSIDERLCSLFGGTEPEWIGFQASDGGIYVNCMGKVGNDEKQVELELQFSLSDDLESFMLSALLIDGAEQTEGFIARFEEQFGE